MVLVRYNIFKFIEISRNVLLFAITHLVPSKLESLSRGVRAAQRRHDRLGNFSPGNPARDRVTLSDLKTDRRVSLCATKKTNQRRTAVLSVHWHQYLTIYWPILYSNVDICVDIMEIGKSDQIYAFLGFHIVEGDMYT